MKSMDMPPHVKRKLSIIVPVRNEAESLAELSRRVQATLTQMNMSGELLLIDDGSTDASWSVIQQLQQQHPDWIRGFHHRRNFGKADALALGFSLARGEYIVTMDGDLQDQPEEIPKLLQPLLDDQFDLVSGWKQNRKDPADKTLPSKIFNFMARSVSGINLHDFNCGFKAYRKEVAKSIHLYGELHRFIPMLAYAEGFRIGEVVVAHEARQHGKSNYGPERIIKGMLDLVTVVLLTRYLRRPAHFFGGIGFLIGIASLAILAYLSLGWFIGHKGIGTRPLFFFGIMGTILSAQFLTFGFVAELLSHHSRNKRNLMEHVAEIADET
jgi:glycosyltransferase involved in cell wall biosynthesis